MAKRWIFKEPANPTIARFLQTELKIDEVTSELLVQRGIDTYRKARAFFRPALDQLHDPFLMKGMREAVIALKDAMDHQEPILLYGDYDVDGTTSVALLYSFLLSFNSPIGYYIPDRHTEGYGVSRRGIDWAVENGYKWMVTLDCGITAVEQVAYANEKGLKVIVSDHHLPTETLPEAVAILNPKQIDCPYPFKELSGCGIGFKLAQAFTEHLGLPTEPLYNLLDLLAVSIASDIVPITGENRILAYHGLKKLNEQPCPGLAAIIEICNPQRKDLTISDIVFNIGPRINAAGRMGDAKKAVEVLMAKEKLDAFNQAKGIDTDNSSRRDVDNVITREALIQAQETPGFADKRTTVVFGPSWHKGVIGIVASRLIEQFHRPTIVFSQADGKLTGSARTVNGYNIYEALNACSEHILQFGGHKFAAGLTLKEGAYEAFVEKFEQVVAETIREDQLIPRVDVDMKLKFAQISPQFFRRLSQFAPFGPGNMTPVFATEGVFCEPGMARIVGENHLLLQLRQEHGPSFQAIAFGMKNMHMAITKGLPFDVAYTIEENTWRGQTTLKLNIKDISI